MLAVGVVGRNDERAADVAREQVAGLPVTVVDLLLTAAVIGVEGDVATLAAAHGADTAEVMDLLDEARTRQLVDIEAGRRQVPHPPAHAGGDERRPPRTRGPRPVPVVRVPPQG